MKNNNKSLISVAFLSLFILIVFWFMLPRSTDDADAPIDEFSTSRALEHVKKIADKPHYVGSENHESVAAFIQEELKNLGLTPLVQEGYSLTEWGNLVKAKNIMARIEGSGAGKALVLLSHYDSAPHSASKGAADDGVGVAAILESVRAYQAKRTAHKNDIIILFTDAEELGLNGAAAFVSQHAWAKDVGFVLNLEARGSAGPSFMLMETNNGNAALVRAFSDAGCAYPAASSLMYSIYKMLPNDTDLTVFRENAKIQGFNFAFIDDHFNYHTAQDDVAHLDLRSLAHQGSYLVPLMTYFGNADLSRLDSDQDNVYFNAPFLFIDYPFSWIFPMLIICLVLLFGVIMVGIGKRILAPADIGKGFLVMLGAMATTGLAIYFGWKIVLGANSNYNEILQGFTYNGHTYMAAFMALAIAISFLWYGNLKTDNQVYAYSVAPLIFWTIICLLLGIYLPGASFFIIPVLAATIILGIFVATQRSWQGITLVLSIPALCIFVPLMWTLPIGLGLKILFASGLLLMLTFGLMLPVFGSFGQKRLWAAICFLAAIGFFIQAHFSTDWKKGQAKPNSLVYVHDVDSGKSVWATYDSKPDDWTKAFLTQNPGTPGRLNSLELFSKYGTKFTFSAPAPEKNLPQPDIQFLRDTVANGQRYLKIQITPQRKVNRYDILASEKMVLHNLKANGVKHINQEKSAYKRLGRKVLSYYVVDQQPLVLEFSYSDKAKFEMELLESSFDLLENPLFSVPARPDHMMPKPFVLNDAVALRMKIKPTPKPMPEEIPVPIPTARPENPAMVDTTSIP